MKRKDSKRKYQKEENEKYTENKNEDENEDKNEDENEYKNKYKNENENDAKEYRQNFNKIQAIRLSLEIAISKFKKEDEEIEMDRWIGEEVKR
jgi:hypothetical protein